MTSLYEGILGDIEDRVNTMDDDLESTYNFPDKSAVQKYQAGVRFFDWIYPRATDNDTVKAFIKRTGCIYHEPEHYLATRIRINIYTHRDEGTYKHNIVLGIESGYAFASLSASMAMNGSAKKAVDQAYELLKHVKNNPEMIEWLAKRSLEELYKKSRLPHTAFCHKNLELALNKFNRK